MTELTGLTVWGETVKKVKTVRTKNYMSKIKYFFTLLPVPGANRSCYFSICRKCLLSKTYGA